MSDLSQEALLCILNYLYCDQLTITPTIATELLMTAGTSSTLSNDIQLVVQTNTK